MEGQESRVGAAYLIDWISGGEQKLAKIFGDLFRKLSRPASLQPGMSDFQDFKTRRFVNEATPRLRQVERSAGQIPALVRFEDYANRKRRPNSDNGA